jgi:hypothetical protein
VANNRRPPDICDDQGRMLRWCNRGQHYVLADCAHFAVYRNDWYADKLASSCRECGNRYQAEYRQRAKDETRKFQQAYADSQEPRSTSSDLPMLEMEAEIAIDSLYKQLSVPSAGANRLDKIVAYIAALENCVEMTALKEARNG